METTSDLDKFLKKIPDRREIEHRLSVNLNEAKLLRRLLKIADDRNRVEEARSCK